jgi:hypothetical protein
MINQHLNRSIKNHQRQIEALLNICETEIEKWFLVKIISYMSNRPFEFSYSFICEQFDTEEVDGKEVMKYYRGYYEDAYSGINIIGLRIEKKNDNYFLELFPQKDITGDILSHKKNYRLDFSIEKYDAKNGNQLLQLYCIECDGHYYHSTKEQISSDNKRARELLLKDRYTTLRFSGSELLKWGDTDVGEFLFNL